MFDSIKKPFLLVLLALMGLSGCIALDVQESQVVEYRSKNTAVNDTFNIVYFPTDSLMNKQEPPKAKLVFNFWEPQFFENDESFYKTLTLKNYKDQYWLGQVVVPADAQVLSYSILNRSDWRKNYSKNYLVLNKQKVPVPTSHYRLAVAMHRNGAPTDTIMYHIKQELKRYPNHFDAYILYWTLMYEKGGKTQEALAELENQIARVRRNRRDNSDLLQAISLTYIHAIGDRRKAYEVVREIPDTYLHKLNLYNRFLVEPDEELREMALMTMTEKYPSSELTVQMNLALLLKYISNPNAYRERSAIFAQNILNQRLSSLRTSKVNTYAVRHLFDYYAKINLKKALPYVQDILRIDYDRVVYDAITLAGFAERFATSQEYSGLAIDIANKLIQNLDVGNVSFNTSNVEREMPDQKDALNLIKDDLTGRAYYAIGQSYLTIGDRLGALDNLYQAQSLSFSKQPEILFALAQSQKTANPKAALDYALESIALKYDPQKVTWVKNEFKKSTLGSLKSTKGFESKLKNVKASLSKPAPNMSLTTVAGEQVFANATDGSINVYYFWSSHSEVSKMFFSKLQLLYAKYRARGVNFYAITTDNDLAPIVENAREYAYSFPFARGTDSMIREYKVAYLPTTVIVKDGNIQFREESFMNNYIDHVETAIQSLLRSNPRISRR